MLFWGSWDSSVIVVTKQRAGRLDSRQRQEIFVFSETSKLARGLAQPPTKGYGGEGACLWTKWPGREAGHLLPSSAEI